jgi:hypothetical protein
MTCAFAKFLHLRGPYCICNIDGTVDDVSHVILVWTGQPIEAGQLSGVMEASSLPSTSHSHKLWAVAEQPRLSLSLCSLSTTHKRRKERLAAGSSTAPSIRPAASWLLRRSKFHPEHATPSMASLCFSSVATTSRSRKMPSFRPEPPRFLVVSCDTRTAAADVYSSLVPFPDIVIMLCKIISL